MGYLNRSLTKNLIVRLTLLGMYSASGRPNTLPCRLILDSDKRVPGWGTAVEDGPSNAVAFQQSCLTEDFQVACDGAEALAGKHDELRGGFRCGEQRENDRARRAEQGG